MAVGPGFAGFADDTAGSAPDPSDRMDEPATRLFLITPVLDAAEPFAASLSATLATGDVACVLLRHAGRDERSAKALLNPLVAEVQRHGAAALVQGDERLAAYAGADGVQVDGPGQRLDDAVESLKPDRIVGVGGLRLRDDAMVAGEADVDYLLFGEPGPDGSLPDPADTLERVQWWAEIFNMPCVGFAQSIADVGPLARAGAEFVALGDAVWSDARGPAAAVSEAQAVLQAVAAQAGAA